MLAAEALEITLTSRGKDRKGENIPMAGVPHHAAAGYLARLLEQGRLRAAVLGLGPGAAVSPIPARASVDGDRARC